jgi:hypothetical protein
MHQVLGPIPATTGEERENLRSTNSENTITQLKFENKQTTIEVPNT